MTEWETGLRCDSTLSRYPYWYYLGCCQDIKSQQANTRVHTLDVCALVPNIAGRGKHRACFSVVLIIPRPLHHRLCAHLVLDLCFYIPTWVIPSHPDIPRSRPGTFLGSHFAVQVINITPNMAFYRASINSSFGRQYFQCITMWFYLLIMPVHIYLEINNNFLTCLMCHNSLLTDSACLHMTWHSWWRGHMVVMWRVLTTATPL